MKYSKAVLWNSNNCDFHDSSWRSMILHELELLKLDCPLPGVLRLWTCGSCDHAVLPIVPYVCPLYHPWRRGIWAFRRVSGICEFSNHRHGITIISALITTVAPTLLFLIFAYHFKIYIVFLYAMGIYSYWDLIIITLISKSFRNCQCSILG